MPAYKKAPSRGAKKRDFWGDETEGQRLDKILDCKFGKHFGARKTALETLGIGRRLLNMYLTGERAIPQHMWNDLKVLPEYDGATQARARFTKSQRKPKPVPTLLFIDDDVDPLS